jgi:DNA replication regulator DPB11
LTKQITHLISFRTEGQKYKAAKNWGLKIVSMEWVRDSLERGMILDEKLYDPCLPPDERGKGAWDKTKPKRTSLGKRPREDSTGLEGGKRKIRRTASTKLNSQHDGLWGDIVGANKVAQVERSGVWETNDKDERCANIPSIPMETGGNTHTASLQSAQQNVTQKNGMFGSCRFYLHGFEPKQSEILQSHLITHDAEVANTMEELLELPAKNPSRVYRIVPHDLPVSRYPVLPELQFPIETITTWWVERCLHHKRFENPDEHVIGRPFPKFPITGFEDNSTHISSSGFTGIDLLHFKKAVQLIGATYSEDLTPTSSVLVAKNLTAVRKDKLDHAQQWEIPIVSADWLWDSISAGERLSKKDYRYRPKKRRGSLPNPSITLAKEPCRNEQSKSDAEKHIAKVLDAQTTAARPSRDPAIDRTAFDPEEPINVEKTKARSFRGSTLDRTAFDAEESIVDPQASTTRISPESPIDRTAFDPEPVIKNERVSQVLPPATEASCSTNEDASLKSEPLAERSLDSTSRTISTAPAPSNHPAPALSAPDWNDNITNLLSKTKASSAHARPAEPTNGRRRPNRILGRATSGGNASATSSSLSRATSVDSTATTGNAVEYPTAGLDKTSNERMEMLLNNADRDHGNTEDSQPPQTQIEYEDDDAIKARALVMARMNGENVDKRRTGMKVKAVTIGDFMDLSGAGKRSTRRTGKGNLR